MRATYKLGRNVITEFESQNIGNSISGVQISKIFRERGGGNARFWNMSHGQGMRLDPRLPVELRWRNRQGLYNKKKRARTKREKTQDWL